GSPHAPAPRRPAPPSSPARRRRGGGRAGACPPRRAAASVAVARPPGYRASRAGGPQGAASCGSPLPSAPTLEAEDLAAVGRSQRFGERVLVARGEDQPAPRRDQL